MGGRKGQVSTELIIVIAALLAVALILVVQLQKTATEWSKKEQAIDSKLEAGVDKTLKAASPLKSSGSKCTEGSECKSGECNDEGVCN